MNLQHKKMQPAFFMLVIHHNYNQWELNATFIHVQVL